MCNCSKKCNCNITQITKGEKGDNGTDGANGTNGIDGTNGTNAFKFVKEFITEEPEQPIIIPYVQWSACGTSPIGCLADGTTANPFIDIHIQLWLYINADIPYWLLLSNGAFATTFSYNVTINSSTGDITIITDGNSGTYRLVILA
ncbi:MAG: hypothetical protein ACOVJ5_00515 [Gloeomargaritales cyanobacterium]